MPVRQNKNLMLYFDIINGEKTTQHNLRESCATTQSNDEAKPQTC